MNAIKVIGGVEISRISEQMASGTLVAAAVLATVLNVNYGAT